MISWEEYRKRVNAREFTLKGKATRTRSSGQSPLRIVRFSSFLSGIVGRFAPLPPVQDPLMCDSQLTWGRGEGREGNVGVLIQPRFTETSFYGEDIGSSVLHIYIHKSSSTNEDNVGFRWMTSVRGWRPKLNNVEGWAEMEERRRKRERGQERRVATGIETEFTR